jgi:hypothetical protein
MRIHTLKHSHLETHGNAPYSGVEMSADKKSFGLTFMINEGNGLYVSNMTRKQLQDLADTIERMLDR